MADSQKKHRGFFPRKNQKQQAAQKEESEPTTSTAANNSQKQTNQNRPDNKPSEHAVIAPPPPPPDSSKPPAPRHLATKQTPYKNDPMYMESLVFEGDRGLIPSPRIETFSPSFDSFLPLVHADYYNIVAANRPFGKSVSLSVYAYYNIMHLWARAYAILRHRKQLTEDETRFLEQFEHDLYPATEPINSFLRCIGDFCDTNGVQHHFKLVQKPNKHGHFGRISVQTHNLYEAYPAPHIAITRIIKDMEYTARELNDPIWEIPALRPHEAKSAEARQNVAGQRPAVPPAEDRRREEEIPGSDEAIALRLEGVEDQPDVEPAEQEEQEVFRDMPTVNLLGWFPAQKLSANQLQPLEQCSAGGGFQLNTAMMFCAAIMRHVASNLNSLANYKRASALHESSSGSVGQEAFLDVMEVRDFHRAAYYSGQIARVTCLSGLDVRLANGMRIMGLRIKKNTIQDLNPWACYDFDRYSEVPRTWVANRNNIFAVGLEIQAHGTQHTVIADREQYVLHFLRQAIVRGNRT